jgi:hypothetical protein
VADATLKEMAHSAGGDIRLLLGQLQMVRLRAAALTYDDVKVRGSALCMCLATVTEDCSELFKAKCTLFCVNCWCALVYIVLYMA